MRGILLNCFAASFDSRTVQFMAELVKSHVFAASELSFSSANQGLLPWGEYIVGVDQLFGLDEHGAASALHLHKIALLEAESLADPFRDDDLAPLPNSAKCRFFCVSDTHTTRIADVRSLSSPISVKN